MYGVEFTWAETKRAANLRAHRLDFLDAIMVFAGLTYTFEDDRFHYDERRFITLGLLHSILVTIVHTEQDHEIRIISFRKASRREAQIYFAQVQD